MMSERKSFDIFVVNDEEKGLQGIRVVMVYERYDFDGEKMQPSLDHINGLTDTNGWFGIDCKRAFKAEIFLDNRSYGNYWCENGVRIPIKI
ncbi:MAG: hypothetical protein AAB946_01415 [Patescibacteria group bacterium]